MKLETLDKHKCDTRKMAVNRAGFMPIGFLHILAPNLLPNPLGLILAGFYSALIALLANAGKIK
jgi:hypothetical protein